MTEKEKLTQKGAKAHREAIGNRQEAITKRE